MHTKFGQYAVPETPSSLARLHWHTGGPLKPVDHEPKVDVLDQEDLIQQGIRCSTFIPGALDVAALGSCTANTATEALSNVLPQTKFLQVTGASSYGDTVEAEKFAITFYHRCTDQTGNPAQEWPPTDCGSSGQYVVQELHTMGLVKTDAIAHGAENIISLLQSDGLMVGAPWFNAWMEPDSNGFIDGDGSPAALQAAIQSGVAGGHEWYLSAAEKVALTATDRVDPVGTVCRGRNHWTKSFGDHGSFRFHLSTLVMLGQYADLRQLVLA